MSAVPAILARDVFREPGATLTDSAFAVNPEYLHDWRDYAQASQDLTLVWTTSVDLGAGNTLACDAVALINHNLGTSTVAVSVEYATSPAGPWTQALADVATGSDTLRRFVPVGAFRSWRVKLAGPAGFIARVGELLLGPQLKLDFPMDWESFDPEGEQIIHGGAPDTARGFQMQQAPAYVARSLRFRWSILGEVFTQPYIFQLTQYFRPYWEQLGSQGYPSAVLWHPGEQGTGAGGSAAEDEPETLWGIAEPVAPTPFVLTRPYLGTAKWFENFRSLELTFHGRRR